MYNKEEIKQQRKNPKENSENKINSFVTEMKKMKTENSKGKTKAGKSNLCRLIKESKKDFIKIEKT